MRNKSLLAILLVATLLGGCQKEPPSRWDTTNKSTASAAVAAGSIVLPTPSVATDKSKVEAGGSFNKFFPKDGYDGTSRVFTQEKVGFAEAKLMKGAEEVVLLSISDTANAEDAKKKFEAAKDKVAGFPMITVGKNQSTVLVKDRWQVKASSKSLDAAARTKLLEAFDLAGLATFSTEK